MTDLTVKDVMPVDKWETQASRATATPHIYKKLQGQVGSCMWRVCIHDFTNLDPDQDPKITIVDMGTVGQMVSLFNKLE